MLLERVYDSCEALLVPEEEVCGAARDRSDLFHFYFFILFFLAESEVERLVGCVNVVIDESDVSEQLNQELPLFLTRKRLADCFDVLSFKEGGDLQSRAAAGGQAEC